MGTYIWESYRKIIPKTEKPPDYDLCVFSPPARWGLLDFIRVVVLLFLAILLLLLASPSSFSSTMSASTSTSTSALPPLRQIPSSVCAAGPQPGTFPAQCAPLDFNLGPSQLSVHRWTSTWDLPRSVCTAGLQPETFPAQCQKICQIKCHKICQIECQKICQIEC